MSILNKLKQFVTQSKGFTYKENEITIISKEGKNLITVNGKNVDPKSKEGKKVLGGLHRIFNDFDKSMEEFDKTLAKFEKEVESLFR